MDDVVHVAFVPPSRYLEANTFVLRSAERISLGSAYIIVSVKHDASQRLFELHCLEACDREPGPGPTDRFGAGHIHTQSQPFAGSSATTLALFLSKVSDSILLNLPKFLRA